VLGETADVETLRAWIGLAVTNIAVAGAAEA